jgi:hypothetical protein
MASVTKTLDIAARPEHVWAALEDFHAVHRRVAPGFVTDSKPDGDARIVTFANGTSAREVLLDSDAEARRLSYTIMGNERLKHYSASVQVFEDKNGGCRVIWTSDFLPSDLKPYISSQMGEGAKAMVTALAERKA